MSWMMGLIALLAAANPPTGLRAYATCPGASQLDRADSITWTAQSSRLADHRRLRTELGVLLPEGTTRILFYSHARHHSDVRSSVVATRSTGGVWHISAVGVDQSLVPPPPGRTDPPRPEPMKPIDRDLTTVQGRALDTLLADRCLYAAPTFQSDPAFLVGGAEQALEIEMPHRHWTGGWFGARTPEQNRLIELIASPE